jgi:hypothetical protein
MFADRTPNLFLIMLKRIMIGTIWRLSVGWRSHGDDLSRDECDAGMLTCSFSSCCQRNLDTISLYRGFALKHREQEDFLQSCTGIIELQPEVKEHEA